MKFVVTGAAGFLGASLVSFLRARGVSVVAVSRRAAPGTMQVGDYRQTPSGDVLVHLAQESDRSVVNALGVEAEAQSAATLADLISRDFARIVYVSSAVLYGDQGTSARSVRDAIHVGDTYGRIKSLSERAVLATGRGTVLRVANLYGPGMSASNVLTRILQQIPGSGALVVRDSAPVRDFLWHTDAAAGIHALSTGSTQGIFNLGSGIGTSIGELARLALDVAGEPARPIVATHVSGQFSSLVLDISETLQRSAWRPVTTLRDGVAQLINCFDNESV